MRTDAFALRHLGPRDTDLNYMFKTIGVENLEQLIFETLWKYTSDFQNKFQRKKRLKKKLFFWK
jgi:glycine cleavage system pyridoxal-binding protein P